MNRLKSGILSCVMIVLLCVPAFASETNSLSIRSGAMSNNPNLQASVDDFFEARSFTQDSLQSRSALATADPVRMDAIRQYSEDTELTIIRSTSTPIIESATYSENGDVILDVYEWVSVEYIPDGCDNVDYMGYETQHTMTLRNVNGEYVCIDDINDELDLLLYGDCIPGTEVTPADNSVQNNDAAESTTAYITFADYDVTALVEYADSWVEHKIHSETATGPHKYNPDYGYFLNNDCANYVSQCMYAGGLPFDEGSGRNNTSTSQWWFDTSKVVANQSNSNYTCPPPWRSVSNMSTYFKNKGYEIQAVASGGTNVFPGNPVYASGHIVMCVGYNDAGKPICNGHTRDVWHYVYNYATAASGRSTILIVDEDLT